MEPLENMDTKRPRGQTCYSLYPHKCECVKTHGYRTQPCPSEAVSVHPVIQILEVVGIAIVVVLLCYMYYHCDTVAFYGVKGFALLGYPNAQSYLGQRYIQGRGVRRNHTLAMQWFREAASQGHAHASYNLAVGHLQGYRSELAHGEARKLLKFASSRGVEKATHVLTTICNQGKHCDY